ncbi:MAG: ATP-binding protein [Kofleriaceae bacterium]
MTSKLHPLLGRVLRKVGASHDSMPSLDAWRAFLDLVSRTYNEADQDRYTIERAMDVSSSEMQGLYVELEQRGQRELGLLRQSDERHRSLFDGNPLPIWVLDAETLCFVEVNDAMIQTYGYSRDEFLGMTLADIKQLDDVSGIAHSVGNAAMGAPRHVGLLKHRRKDGKLLEMDITVHMITFEGRRRVLGIGLDMTQTRKVEDELRQSQKMEAIGQLAGGIAHDFNNVLAVILANAEFGIEELGENHVVSRDLHEVMNAANRAAGLTRQLLTFSRKQRRLTKPLALNAIVTGIEAMLSRIVGEDIAMSAMITPDLGTIDADPSEVEQVLMNLVVNARDAMQSGGRLLLETMNTVVDDDHAERIGVMPGRYVVLSVTDTGCGMSEAIRSRIFEPFFTTKDVGKGTGLGLSTVFGIVKQCNGGIAVRSKPGDGTTFKIYWPRIDAIALNVTNTRFVPIRGSGTVLVVEDDKQVRQILRRYLTSWGYTSLEAPDGAAALELLRQIGSVDLLLTDLVMPGIDGRALSRCVLLEKPDTKVVFMSGYTEHPTLKNAALGPDDYFVQKPFSAQALSETLHRVFAGHAATKKCEAAAIDAR